MTACRVDSATASGLLRARLTVAVDTPANFATSMIFAARTPDDPFCRVIA
jgi:hypothetical protein